MFSWKHFLNYWKNSNAALKIKHSVGLTVYNLRRPLVAMRTGLVKIVPQNLAPECCLGCNAHFLAVHDEQDLRFII